MVGIMRWEELVQQFYTQGMIGLGKLHNPLTGQTQVDLRLAKISIEVLALLEEKTQGNLSETEKRILQDALHVLRVNYALEKERQAQQAAQTSAESGSDSPSSDPSGSPEASSSSESSAEQ